MNARRVRFRRQADKVVHSSSASHGSAVTLCQAYVS